MSRQWKIAVTPSASGVNPWPARVSVPVPQGENPAGFSVARPDGQTVPAQSRVLTRWPDGSPRWVQLDFQTDQTGDHVVDASSHRGDEVAAGSPPPHVGGYTPSLPVQATREVDKFTIHVGRLQLIFDPHAASPIESVEWDGRDLRGHCQFTAVDREGKPFPVTENAAPKVTVESEGAHRFQVSWETHHAGNLLDVRFRLEVLAGIEGFTLSYQFFHKLPQYPSLTFRSINADFSFGAFQDGNAVVSQTCYGNLGFRRFVRANHAVKLHLDRTRFSTHVKDAGELDDDFDYPPFMRGVNLDTGSAVALESEAAAVVFAMREFDCQRLKTLTVQPGGIAVGIWPEEAGPLDLPQGRSNRQVFAFRFCEPKPEQVDSLLANPLACWNEPSVAWLDKADSHHAGASWDQPRLFEGTEPGAALFSHLLQSVTSRWESLAEMFHYGDVAEINYTVYYPSTGRTPATNPQIRFGTSSIAHPHFHAAHDLHPVWANNEYDAIYCVALEAIRTRDLGVWRKLRAAARHQIEVDFVHYSDHWQQHRSTPQHSYDHTSLMGSIPSHQWTQGLYYYFVLTGDDDVPDVVRGICEFDFTYLENDEIAFTLFFNRELGWALVSLVFGYELTADQRYLDMSKKIIEKLQRDAARTDFAEVEKVSSASRGLNATGIGTGFAPNTIPLGVKVYHQATGEAWAKKLLLEWVDYGMTNFNNKTTGVKFEGLFPETFCYVCELTGEKRYLEESLWQLRMFYLGFGSLDWLEPLARPLTTKLYARGYRGMVHYLSALSSSGMLAEIERDLTTFRK